MAAPTKAYHDLRSNYIAGQRVTNKLYSTGAYAATGASPTAAAIRGLYDRASVEVYLQGANGAYWTDTRLRQTNFNDLIYAARLIAEPATIG